MRIRLLMILMLLALNMPALAQDSTAPAPAAPAAPAATETTETTVIDPPDVNVTVDPPAQAAPPPAPESRVEVNSTTTTSETRVADTVDAAGPPLVLWVIGGLVLLLILALLATGGRSRTVTRTEVRRTV